MKIKSRILLLTALLLTITAHAWNLPAKNVNALRFEKNGRILFTLFDNGPGSAEFQCGTGANSQWFYIVACTEAMCVSRVNRMASMLLAAKVAGKRVHVQRSNCVVTEVALKP